MVPGTATPQPPTRPRRYTPGTDCLASLAIVHASPILLSGTCRGASKRVAYDAKDKRVRYQEAAIGERQEVAVMTAFS